MSVFGPEAIDPSTQRKPTIKSRVSIHDRSSVEATFTYSLESGRGKTSTDLRYQVDAYLFFPVQSRIGPGSYSKHQFYNDAKALVRLREPRLSFKEMIGKREGSTSPLDFISSVIRNYKEKGEEAERSAIEEARVFGCAFIGYYWRRVERRCRRIRNAPSTADQGEKVVADCLAIFQRGAELLKRWRKLRVLYDEQISDEGLKQLKAELEMVDEYCAYCFRDGLLRIIREISDLGGHATLDMRKVVRKANAHLRLERWYAGRASFHWVTAQSSDVAQEDYVFRRGALKRRIWSVFYLNPRPDLFLPIRRHLGPMVAAGMASSWAIIASLLLWQHYGFKGFMYFSGLSATSVALIVAFMVISYVLKDRIKELGRDYSEKVVPWRLPDLTSHMYHEDILGKPVHIGVINESFSFRKNNKTPNEVVALRIANNDRVIDPDEMMSTAIHYSKDIKLDKNVIDRLRYPVKAVHDIFRLNIESYLLHLDDPYHRGLAPDEDEGASELLMPKVYYLDLILRYSPLRSSKQSERVVYDYFRLVINKKGLIRIEQLK